MPRLELLFVAAFALYTLAIWADRRAGAFRPWMAWAFGLGLAADAAATVLLCATVPGAFRLTFHAVTGFAALVIMALHFAWALAAVRQGGSAEARFRRWSVPAWAVWMASFLSGALFH